MGRWIESNVDVLSLTLSWWKMIGNLTTLLLTDLIMSVSSMIVSDRVLVASQTPLTIIGPRLLQFT